MAREPKITISPEQAQTELDGILADVTVDDLAFARAHYCLRVLGCPVADSGKPKVIEEQEGELARHMWDFYADIREILRDRHDLYREMHDDNW